MLSWTADENAVRLPGTLVQPIAAADVAKPWPTSAWAHRYRAPSTAGHPQRRGPRGLRGLRARRTGQDHPRRPS
jgi:hypothetical protein